MSINGIGKRFFFIGAIVSLALTTGLTSADETSDIGAAFAIADDAYDGSLASFSSGTISVTGHTSIPGLTIIDVEVTIRANHTWIGDLGIMLQSPNGTRVGLMSRPLLAEAGAGAGCCGTDDNWTNTPETWFQDGTYDPETSFIAVNLGKQMAWRASPDTLAAEHGAGFSLSDFNGGVANGTWTLYAGDSAADDVGSINSWRLDITTSGPAACNFAVGDVNNDGVVSLLDISAFVASLTGGPGAFVCEADINIDGLVTLLDVQPFVQIVTGG